jgi:DNA uptake protein ComE-like DNA-binding protein
MNRGWSAYLTLYSMELNVRPDGNPKIDLNMDDMEELYEQLKQAVGEEFATFIVAFRQNGPYSGSEKPKKAAGQLDLSEPGEYKLQQTILELIGRNVEVKFKGDENSTVLETPFPDVSTEMDLYLPVLMDNVTINPARQIPGRINVNQASRTVLAGIPGMTDEILDKIISEREPNPAEAEPHRRYETWLLSEELVTLDEMKSLIPFLTGGGDVYRAQVIGYFDRGGPTVRIEAILDATAEPAKVLFFRDLSHLGRGYPKTVLGIETSDR